MIKQSFLHITGKLFSNKNNFATSNYFRSQRQSYRLGCGKKKKEKKNKTFKEHEIYKPVLLCILILWCFCLFAFFKKSHLGISSQFLAFGHLDKGANVHLLK